MSLVGVIGLGLSIAGGVIQYSAQQRMVKQQEIASKQAENARQQQAQLQAQNERRQAIRQAAIARAQSLNAGVSQGAQYGTGVAGGIAQGVNQGAENQYITNSSEVLGNRVFAANRAYFEATSRGQAGMALGQGISSLGGAIVNNAGTINRLGTYYTQRPSNSNLNRGFGG